MRSKKDFRTAAIPSQCDRAWYDADARIGPHWLEQWRETIGWAVTRLAEHKNLPRKTKMVDPGVGAMLKRIPAHAEGVLLMFALLGGESCSFDRTQIS
jgi:hypothetical protein